MAAPSFNAGTYSINQPGQHENQNPPMSYSNQRSTWSPYFGEPLREFAGTSLMSALLAPFI